MPRLTRSNIDALFNLIGSELAALRVLDRPAPGLLDVLARKIEEDVERLREEVDEGGKEGKEFLEDLLPKPPWRLVHLGDTSVMGGPSWEATLHAPINDPEYMFESKWGQGGTPEEALKAARDAKGDKVMRYITTRGGAGKGDGKVTPGLTFEGEIDDDEVMF
jgi:hypothetical protein